VVITILHVVIVSAYVSSIFMAECFILIIFIHQHNVVGNKTKIRRTVTRLWHITDTHDLNCTLSILTG